MNLYKVVLKPLTQSFSVFDPSVADNYEHLFFPDHINTVTYTKYHFCVLEHFKIQITILSLFFFLLNGNQIFIVFFESEPSTIVEILWL